MLHGNISCHSWPVQRGSLQTKTSSGVKIFKICIVRENGSLTIFLTEETKERDTGNE